jgi:hypothetical protein
MGEVTHAKPAEDPDFLSPLVQVQNANCSTIKPAHRQDQKQQHQNGLAPFSHMRRDSHVAVCKSGGVESFWFMLSFPPVPLYFRFFFALFSQWFAGLVEQLNCEPRNCALFASHLSTHRRDNGWVRCK